MPELLPAFTLLFRRVNVHEIVCFQVLAPLLRSGEQLFRHVHYRVATAVIPFKAFHEPIRKESEEVFRFGVSLHEVDVLNAVLDTGEFIDVDLEEREQEAPAAEIVQIVDDVHAQANRLDYVVACLVC